MRFVPFIFCLSIIGCMSTKPKISFNLSDLTDSPDYSQQSNWAALPFKRDPADLIPDSNFFINRQVDAKVDVFFIHPTTYTGKRGENQWNANLNDEILNLRTDNSSIKYQASIFNGVGRVYAPRYRQAHYHSYFSDDKESAIKAFEIAYQDVKKSFEFYLNNYNSGRPIVLAAHSQGSQHGQRLLAEFFDEKDLQDQLVVAYLVGMPIPKNSFKDISVCKDEVDTKCFCSWRTFKKNYTPKNTPKGDSIAVTNPLIWNTDEAYASARLNLGGVLTKFENGLLPRLNDAQIKDGYLWVTKPRFPGSIFYLSKNYHIADYNLFYANVRRNAQQRTQRFLTLISREQ